MASRVSETEIDNFIDLHLSGKTPDQIAAITGRGHNSIRQILKARGVFTDHRIHTLPIPELTTRFNAGESVNALAARYGVSRNVVDLRLRKAGIEPRGQSEAELLKWARMNPSQRKRQVSRAHAAARGKPKSLSSLLSAAQTKERKGLFDSEIERELSDLLLARGIQTTPQLAIGPYNCDLGAVPVAVEVFGGNWHWSGRHLRRLRKRVDYLFDAAFHVLIVQVTARYPLTAGTADYVASYVESARRNPAAWREYRVVRGDGETIAQARSDRDDWALVPSFRVTRNALGRYESIPD